MSAIQRLRDLYADYEALDKAVSLLHWDRQVLMPPAGGAARTAQVGRLTRMAHERLTSDAMQRAVEDAASEAAPGSTDAAMVRAIKRDLSSELKLPTELVERKSRVSSEAYDTWRRAKPDNDFPALRPYLEQLFEIARETAELLGYSEHIYDPLLDLYEEGATTDDATRMFAAIRQPIIDLVRQTDPDTDDAFLYRDWDKEKLKSFAQRTSQAIGFDYSRGHLSVAANAFCTTISSADVRMTTRPSEALKGIVSSTLHEMGHGLYEQGSPVAWDRTPLAGGVSLAVHESQSRLWENIVGRALPFWEHFLPDLKETFPELNSVPLDAFYRAVNKVKPEFVRVGADELTYNLHILVRFELEVEIVTGQLAVRDLPEAWNGKYRELLGITPPSDTLGCLQDVHWTRGSVGYFPTYAMGNLIGAQIWKVLQQDLGDTDEMMRRGQFAPILEWLTEKIYRKARSVPPQDLVVQVTGRPMEATDWLDYAKAKYSAISAAKN
jgi:carboxypeptidase Taq